MNILCNWWLGDRTCGAIGKLTVHENDLPDRNLCSHHYAMYRQFQVAA